MAVNTEQTIAGPYLANGVTVVFPFGFKAMSATEVGVLIRDADGNDSFPDSDEYSVTVNATNGGSVQFFLAPVAGSIFIFSDPEFTQDVTFASGQPYLPSVVNKVNDRDVVRQLHLRDRMDRGIEAPIGEALAPLPVADQRAGKFLGFDAEGNPVPLSGTGSDAALRTDLAGVGGSELIGFTMPITEALTRMAEGKMAERVSWLDFLPYGKHAGVLEKTNLDDLTDRIQAMFDEVPAGARLYLPGKVNFEGGLVIGRSIMLYGDPGREYMDNSWDYGNAGTQLRYRGTDEPALTIRAPALNNHRINIVLRDFLAQGNRLTDAGAIVPVTGTADRSVIRVEGGSLHDTTVRLDVDNVHPTQGYDHGWDIVGSVYGGSMRNSFAARNGKCGFRSTPDGGLVFSEAVLMRMRLFQNGQNAETPEDGAGFDCQYGSWWAIGISSSENKGYGAVLGGLFDIGGLQLESNAQNIGTMSGTTAADKRSLVIGSSVSGDIRALLSSPGTGFAGAHIELSALAKNQRIAGLLGDTLDGLTGRHILRRAGSEFLDISGLLGANVNTDEANDFSTVQNLRVTARGDLAAMANLTGDGTVVPLQIPELYDKRGCYDPATGTFANIFSSEVKVRLRFLANGLAADHSYTVLDCIASNTARTLSLGNIGAMRDGNNKFPVKVDETFLLGPGGTVRFTFAVSGGSKTVGIDAGSIMMTIEA